MAEEVPYGVYGILAEKDGNKGFVTALVDDGSEDALLRTAVACYSVEGVYPADVAYLQENYGLRYDTDTFILQYDAFAENILPEIRVLIRGVE